MLEPQAGPSSLHQDEKDETENHHNHSQISSVSEFNLTDKLRLDNDEDDKILSNVIDAQEYLIERGAELLDYEKQMFLDLYHSDGLVVCARGISYDRVLTNLLKVYCDPGNLILVINSTDSEENYFKTQLDPKHVYESSSNMNERERVYLNGGIQFISTRILVVDLLKKRIPIELITGIFVLRAHAIIESCQEAFALRLYRQSNKDGFIKALSNSPESFTYGYGHVEKVMRNLFVRELFIWPRFHAIIQQSLKVYEPTVIELHVPMTSKMVQVQTHILDIMNYIVKELKRINRNVDMQEITVENCVTKKFHKILQAQLDSIWHQLGSQTKLLISDLKVLRSLMISTIYHDCVTLYATMKRYRSTEYAMSNSGWTLLDASDQMFKIAKERVFNADEEFDPESCPKWRALSEILRVEIPNDIKQLINDKNTNLVRDSIKVLILCQDSRTCYQLHQYLTQGAERYLFHTALKNDIPVTKIAKSYQNMPTSSNLTAIKLQNPETPKTNLIPKQSNRRDKISNNSGTMSRFLKSQEKKCEGDIFAQESDVVEITKTSETEDKSLLSNDDDEDCNIFRDSYILTMTQKRNIDENNISEGFDVTQMESSEFEPFPEIYNLDVTSLATAGTEPIVCIQTFKTQLDGSTSLEKTLREMNPNYVIMYHCNVTAIRQLEVFEACQRRHPNNRIKVFFLLHAQTVEEQSYLTSLRREKQAFELLIDTKSAMVIPEFQDGLSGIMKSPEDVSTRQAGGQTTGMNDPPVSKVIVDMREFRSDLPCLIHKRGINIVPVTITIGDYILTPEICVERKSISDLIGSLNSGRLYNQCVQMVRYYAKPILLIEFDQNKPFHLQGHYMVSSSNVDVMQKLQLLTLYFPKLKLVWSPSPYATAQLFEELKQGKPEPDATNAAALGSDEADNDVDISEKMNTYIHDFLLRLPGINSKNINKVMRQGGTLKQLIKQTEEQLTELLGSAVNAKMLYQILHDTHKPVETDAKEKPFISKYKKTAFGRGRKF